MVVIDQVYVLEGIEVQGKGVTVAHAAVKASACVPMRMMNPTDQDITLYKGTRVATLVEAETPGRFLQYKRLRVCWLNWKLCCGAVGGRNIP